MNVRRLKAKRVEMNVLQRDLAGRLGLTEKAMSQKECSERNRFKADEMLEIARALKMSLSEFNEIFFDGNLPNG